MKNIAFPFKRWMYYKYIGDPCEEWIPGKLYRYFGKNSFFAEDGMIYELEGEWGEDDPVQGSFDINTESPHPIPPRCQSHKVSTLSYGLSHEDASKRMAKGQVQRQCDICKLWLFNDQF